MNLAVLNVKTGLAATAALLAGLTAVSACTSKSAQDGKSAAGDITVTATDDGCQLSATSAKTGQSTFVVTNNGSKVTEFYIYSAGDRVMGEIENVSPGLQRKLIVQLPEPGKYTTACKPGMVGDGIRADFTVTGDAVKVDDSGKFKEAADSYKKYVTSQTTELVTVTEAFVSAIKKGDVAGAKALYPKARTYYERIEPVGESFPNELDPRIDLREADLRPGDKWTGFHRLEKELWVTGLQPDSAAVADQLLADVKELDAGVKDPQWIVDSTKIAGGAQSLLDEIGKNKITGEEDIFSHTDLWDFQANVDGSRIAVGSVRPILDERNPDLGKRVDTAFANVQKLLDQYRQGDGFVTYDKVTQPQRQELSRALDALSAEVSEVQGVIAKR
ncbi:peptidase M75 [Mycobacterium sp. CBMA293]|uniref:iron uptake system protein EfeO n=1 Tax=unclassified Mycolicibacterium TaxID=2636767 RepID=UPI00132A8841|nr:MULTISPECIES: iron uptake system protein EfeO [unclassified Mycolicibacterium]MUL49575.1 peptidase M75 [Mycolicibacterium sp. CBMA 360]MUL96684.1 peptidase M75 [Mycolicibacterium sp. CBMA 230]MUL61671.1 peptidase M75 [Mycolicibacterium sp. CBMA 335]MUL74407.1 peptidase M75 [Mycolicibacterium sp. CBMA 311]MUM04155.1 peptidase M75 [Mycolicibacterium sp. CBMA 213]